MSMVRRSVRSFSSEGPGGINLEKSSLEERRKSLDTFHLKEASKNLTKGNKLAQINNLKKSNCNNINGKSDNNNEKKSNGETPKENNNKNKKLASVKEEDDKSIPQRKRRNIRSELDRLLMDEGTVNMLSDKDKNTNKAASKEDKLQALKLRRIEVFNRVKKQTTMAVGSKSLREKRVEKGKKSQKGAASSSDKEGEKWNYDRGIIRSHSSDFSSRDNSPNPSPNFTLHNNIHHNNSTENSSHSNTHLNNNSNTKINGTIMEVDEDENILSNCSDLSHSVDGVNDSGTNKKIRKRASLLGSMKTERVPPCSELDKNTTVVSKKKAEEVNTKPMTPFELYLATINKEPQKSKYKNFREVLVRKSEGVGHIIFGGASASILSYSLSPITLYELNCALTNMAKDKDVKIVLFSSSSGPHFLQGLDLQYLISTDTAKRKKAAEEMASCLKDFLITLANFSKIIICSVHGDAVGFGVTILPLFDLVYASDKATFKTPYSRLGQIPEGLTSLTFTGGKITNAMLFGGKSLTAMEALNSGLVTEVLWPAKFQEELNGRVRSVIQSWSSQGMESTKALLRQNLKSKEFQVALQNECQLLISHWTTSEFQNKAKDFLENFK